MVHTACLVCFISTVNGHCKKQTKKQGKCLGRCGASSGHTTKLKQSIFFRYLWVRHTCSNGPTSFGQKPLWPTNNWSTHFKIWLVCRTIECLTELCYCFGQMSVVQTSFSQISFGQMSAICLLAKYLLAKCLLAKCLLAKCLLAKYLLAKYLLAKCLLAKNSLHEVYRRFVKKLM